MLTVLGAAEISALTDELAYGAVAGVSFLRRSIDGLVDIAANLPAACARKLIRNRPSVSRDCHVSLRFGPESPVARQGLVRFGSTQMT